MSRFIRIALALGQLLLLLHLPDGTAQAADANAEQIALGLKDFGLRLNELGAFEELGEAIPLTALSPGANEALRLGNLFGAAFGGLTTAHDDLDALAGAIDSLGGDVGGVDFGFSSVSVTPNTNPDLIDVTFTVTATRVVTPSVVFSNESVNLNGGGLPIHLGLASTLAFQLDKTQLPANPTLAFYVVGEPAIDLTLDASGSILAFNSRVGFADVSVTGSTTLNGDLQVAFNDPDSNGRITKDEWNSTALVDLVGVAFVNAPGDDVAATLNFETSAPLNVLSGSVALADPSLADGFNPAVTPSLGPVGDFANMDPVQMLNGVGQVAAGLIASQAAGDLPLPFLQQRFGDAFAFAQPLIEFLHQQGDAAIVCGVTDTDLPTGDVSNLLAGDTVYCQAVTLQNPLSVTWTIAIGTGGANATATTTVGINPTVNASFTLTSAGRPQVQVQFNDEGGGFHTVSPIFRSAQELANKLLDLADLDSVGLNYDSGTKSLTYHVVKSSDPAPVGGKLDFGDQISTTTHLIGLIPDSGSSVAKI